MALLKHENNPIETAAQHLSARFGEKVAVRSVVSLAGGCINHAAKMETSAGTFFLKWNANGEPDMFLREAEGLAELKKAAKGELVIPDVYAAKATGDSPGFLVQEYLPPRPAHPGDDEKLGRGLGILHLYQNKQFGFYENNYCGATLQSNPWTDNWAVFFRDQRIGFLLQLIQNERPLPVAETDVYERLHGKIPGLLPTHSTPVLIHGDLWSGNYMMTEKGPALIDPATCYADREMEFAIITLFGGFSQRFFYAYNEVNPLPADWKIRNRLYQLYHVLNHYYLFGGGYQSQALQIARYFAG